MKAIQADVTLFDAEMLTPYIVSAFDNARRTNAPAALSALAADLRVSEAVGWLRNWNYTTPTGVTGGNDGEPGGGNGSLSVGAARVSNSIAATLYSVWRGQVIANGLDRTLAGLGLSVPPSDLSIKAIANLIQRNGVGQSTLDYFAWTRLAAAADRRDFVVLKSLQSALDLLASPAFASAFGGSVQQNDYRWGKLHRVKFDATLGGPFSIPGATPDLAATFPKLSGLAADGGFGTVDAATHNVRANTADGFMFGSGPNRRYVGSVGNWPGSISGETILPGGISGALGDRFYANLLKRYLKNQTYRMRQSPQDMFEPAVSEQAFQPAFGFPQ
jgi:penicillin amidase